MVQERTPHPTHGHGIPLPLVLALAGVIIVLATIVGVGAARYAQAVPPLQSIVTFDQNEPSAATPAGLPWPSEGQAALAVEGLGLVASHGVESGPQPIASTTKIMTAYLVLEHHPLAIGEPGPTLTLTATDEARYGDAINDDESAVEVKEGEQITESELLQGMLLPSANNFAEILAAWDAGSIPAFVDAMNAKAQALGMAETHFDDTSGLSAKTVSSATDMLILAQAAMANPVFAQVVSERTTTVPVAGEVKNTNELLAEPGVIGIKTGNTDEAGDCLIFAAVIGSGDSARRVYGVVLGQPTRAASFDVPRQLLAAVPPWITTTHVISKGDSVGGYVADWGATTRVTAASSIDVTTWAGTPIQTTVSLDKLSTSVSAGQKVGQLTVHAGPQEFHTDVIAQRAIAAPSSAWRIKR
ncbi:MAG: D-alanyl-D-alanine carboxypeptidase [Tepidiformaceae bacterium]